MTETFLETAPQVSEKSCHTATVALDSSGSFHFVHIDSRGYVSVFEAGVCKGTIW